MKLKVGAILGQMGLVFALLLFIFVSVFSFQTLKTLSSSLNQVHLAQHTLDSMIEFHADFLLSPDFGKVSEGAKVINNAKHNIEQLKALPDFNQTFEENYKQALIDIDSYADKFERLTLLIQVIGFDENQGLRGQFRNAAHRLQDHSALQNNDKLTIAILELRRREKDFLLRKTQKYLLLHKQELVNVASLITQPTDNPSVSGQAYLTEYKQAFSKLVAASKEIGLTPEQGLVAEIRDLDKTLFANVASISERLSSNILKTSSDSLIYVSIVMFLLLLISVGFIQWLLKRTYKGLMTLSKQIHHIVKTEDYSNRLDTSNENEFDLLNKDLNKLIAHFETTLDNLSSTTNKLVESEKMAFVGNMVSGVAHELNTPLGIILTSESYVRTKLEQLQKSFEQGQLQKSELKSSFQNAIESLQLIESNLERTATLIDTFKSVSSQHNYDELTEFKLSDLLEAIKLAVAREISKSKCTLTININGVDMVRSYYSAFTQILNILLINAFRHGQTNDRQLEIECNINVIGNDLIVEVSDNGPGIAFDALTRVFEPFYTTKRNNGGTGLGLSVFYSVVTNTFQGEVSAQNKPQGCTFTCSLPINDSSLILILDD